MFGSRSKAVRMAERALVRLIEIRRCLRKDLKQLERVERRTAAMLDRIKVIGETLREDVENCERRLAQAEEAMEALRSALQVADEVLIPALQTAVKKVQATNEADIAMSNYRRGTATPSSVDREM